LPRQAAVRQNVRVPKLGRLGRRPSPWGTAILLWNLWRRLPPKQRQQLMRQARKHGPRIAKQVYAARRKSRR
jgi:hypothetical protein